MTETDLIQRNVEEFSRVQNWMLATTDKESASYHGMYERYIELKVILNASGVNITELDKIKG